jgi:hypothetical protein
MAWPVLWGEEVEGLLVCKADAKSGTIIFDVCFVASVARGGTMNTSFLHSELCSVRDKLVEQQVHS